MDPIIYIIAGAVLALGLSATVGTVWHEARRRRQRERKLAELIQLANDALAAELARISRAVPRVEMQEVDPESDLGRAIIESLGLDKPCGCPNCEESRRIAHAEQKRDER